MLWHTTTSHVQFISSNLLTYSCLFLFFATPIARYNLNLTAFDDLNKVNDSRSSTAVSMPTHITHDPPCIAFACSVRLSNLPTCYCLFLDFSSHLSSAVASILQRSMTSTQWIPPDRSLLCQYLFTPHTTYLTLPLRMFRSSVQTFLPVIICSLNFRHTDRPL